MRLEYQPCCAEPAHVPRAARVPSLTCLSIVTPLGSVLRYGAEVGPGTQNVTLCLREGAEQVCGCTRADAWSCPTARQAGSQGWPADSALGRDAPRPRSILLSYPHSSPTQAPGLAQALPTEAASGAGGAPQRLRPAVAALACGCDEAALDQLLAAAEGASLEALLSEAESGLTPAAEAAAQAAKEQQEEGEGGSEGESACGYAAWLLPLRAGQNRFTVSLQVGGYQGGQGSRTVGLRAGAGSGEPVRPMIAALPSAEPQQPAPLPSRLRHPAFPHHPRRATTPPPTSPQPPTLRILQMQLPPPPTR